MSTKIVRKVVIKINNGLNTVLDASGKVLEMAPKLYDDAIQESAKETGKTLGLIPRTINAALVPLRQWIAHREYNMAETEKLLAHKLENLDPEKVISPEPYVAVPALQSISYSMNNYELRNLYANLLAKSMNIDTKDSVHPSFVEIIKQLSPLDAQVFSIICKNITNPMINLKRKDKSDSGSITLNNNITLIKISSLENISISIDNLERLKLINIPFDAFYTMEELYDPFKELYIYKHYNNLFSNSSDYELEVEKKIIFVTDIGKSFYNICVKDN